MRKLTKRSQMMLYAVSGMGVNMLNLMMGSYLCSALIAGGFAAKDVPFQTFAGKDLVIAAVWSIFVLIAKIVDGVIDIPMASFTDQLKSKWGRRRPSLIIGLVPMIVAYLLFLVVPNPYGATLLNTIYYGVLLCIFYSFYTLTMVTYYATFTEIVETEQERGLISNTKSVCDILYFILGYVVVRMLLNGINIRTVALIVLPLVLTMLIPLFMIKEESSIDIDSVNANEVKAHSVHLFSSLRYTFKNKTFIKWMIVYSFMTFSVQLFLGGINEYFSSVGMNMMLVMICAFAPVPLTLMLYNKIIKNHGFGAAFRYTLIAFTIGMIAMFFIGRMEGGQTKTIFSVVSGLISSFAIGAMFAVAYSIPSQLAADEEERTGVTNSAMYFAVQGLFAGVATGIGTGIVLTALKKASENATGVPAIAYMTLIAAAGTVIAFILTFILPKELLKLGKKEK
ncbi:MAG: MFS transporter [Clostridia bacterium]|nr:MFS transporter [Clostridia bacterium]MBQ3937899.1 MFS transporter [Clostridia bacterium]MBR4636627.1 MFS transporter [Clostridia bacterium]